MPAIEWCQVGRDFVDDRGEVVRAVDGVSLAVEEGETLCLIGTSGSGKTTLLKMVNRLVVPTLGRVTVGGQDVSLADVIALRRGLGYVIQSGGLLPHLDVAANVGLLGVLEGWEAPRIEARVRALLELVNLSPETFAHRRPAELSGGERQRVGVARALVLDPPVLLMDEPFGALDPLTRADLRREFAGLKRAVDKTIVLVTHDLAEAFALGDRMALLDGGRLAQVGTASDLRERPADDFVRRFLEAHFGEPSHG